MDQKCPNADGCPIFTGVLKGREFTTKAYRQKYCEAGESGRADCRRWQVGREMGKVPADLLPNSLKSVSEIGS